MFKIFLVNFPFIDDPRQSKTRPALCLTKPIENVEGEIGSLPYEWKDEIQSKLKSLFQLGK